MYLNTIGVFVNHLHARQRILVQVEKRVGVLLHRLPQRRGIFFETDDVFAHHPENRQMQQRIGKTLDLVGIIRCRDGACPRVREVTQCMDIAQIVGREMVILRLALRIRC